MSAYNPPRENVPIFDASLFEDTVDSGGGLTPAELDTMYLRFPNAQGKEEMASMDVNGVAEFFQNVTLTTPAGVFPAPVFTSNMISSFSIIPTCSAVQPVSTDSSTKIPTTAWVQTAVGGGSSSLLASNNTWTGDNAFNPVSTNPMTSNAVMPLATDSSTKIPTTAWVQTAVDQGSQDLLASNNTWTGTNAFNNVAPITSTATMPLATDSSTKIPTTAWVQSAIFASGGQLIQAPTYIENSFTTDISGLVPLPPIGTRYMKIVQISGGGECIPPYYIDETTVVLGSSGAGGAYTSFTIDVRAWASFTSPMIRYENTGVTPVTNTKSPRLVWTDFACNRYNDDAFSTSIAGLNQVSGGLTSLPFSSQVAYYYAPANWNYYYSYLMETANAYYINGQSWDVGRFKVPASNMFGQFVASNGGGGFYGGEVQTIDASGTSIGGSNPNADSAFDAEIIGPWARGQTQTFTPSPTAPIGVTNATQGQGGWAFYFYG